MKLVSMVKFILAQKETSTLNVSQHDWYCFEIDILDNIRRYANLLDTSLSLGMFVPCDRKGVFMEEPKKSDYTCIAKITSGEYYSKLEEYQEAKNKVLFKDFVYTLTPKDPYSKFKVGNGKIAFYEAGFKIASKVESLVQKVEVQLTSNAQKQIGC